MGCLSCLLGGPKDDYTEIDDLSRCFYYHYNSLYTGGDLDGMGDSVPVIEDDRKDEALTSGSCVPDNSAESDQNIERIVEIADDKTITWRRADGSVFGECNEIVPLLKHDHFRPIKTEPVVNTSDPLIVKKVKVVNNVGRRRRAPTTLSEYGRPPNMPRPMFEAVFAAKNKFRVLDKEDYTKSNILVVRKHIYGSMLDSGMREHHICAWIDFATQMVFVPSKAEILAQKLRNANETSLFTEGYNRAGNRKGGMLGGMFKNTKYDIASWQWLNGLFRPTRNSSYNKE